METTSFSSRVGGGRRVRRRRRNKRLPVRPAVPFHAVVGGHDPVLHRCQTITDGVYHAGVFAVDQHRLHAGVVDDVRMVLRRQPVVQRHQDRADARGGVEALQEKMGVGAEDADPVSLPDAEPRQRVGQPPDPFRVFGVGIAPVAVHDRGLVRVQAHGALQEIVDEQRYLHAASPFRLSLSASPRESWRVVWRVIDYADSCRGNHLFRPCCGRPRQTGTGALA